MKNWIFLTILILQLSCQKKNEISIAFTGDVNLDRGVKKQLNIYGDELLINAFKKLNLQNFVVINFEGTFTNSKQQQKDLYNFKVNKNKAATLKQSGVTHISIANNHVYDYGKIGYEDTLEAINNQKLIPLGNKCEAKIIEQDNNSCAILSVSFAAHNEQLCNSTVNKVKESIIKFKNNNKNIPLILFVHWGLEIQSKPEKWQRVLAKELIDLGIDAIIGHHPHITQTIEFIKNKPVFYSLGNFIGDGYLPNTDYTYTVNLKITNKINDIKITPYHLNHFFPKEINKKEQLIKIRDYLFFSKEVCAFQTKDGWAIKPTNQIDFNEDTSLWVFAANKKCVVIKQMKSGSHLLKVYNQNKKSNPLNIFGTLSEIQLADINNDNDLDIILGVSKKVHFDSVKRKRVNIYTIKNQKLKTLWLGTKFINNIINFSIKNIDDNNYLLTLEKDNDGYEYHRIYEWDNFGFALADNKYKKNEK